MNREITQKFYASKCTFIFQLPTISTYLIFKNASNAQAKIEVFKHKTFDRYAINFELLVNGYIIVFEYYHEQ